jgi:hypothetical protein
MHTHGKLCTLKKSRSYGIEYKTYEKRYCRLFGSCSVYSPQARDTKSSAYRARYLPVAEPLSSDLPPPPGRAPVHIEQVPVPDAILPPRRKPKLILDEAQRELERQREQVAAAEGQDIDDRKRPLDDGMRRMLFTSLKTT